MDDNSSLMQEKKSLEKSLDEMHNRLQHLFEDAEVVRAQINRELTEFKQAEKEINKLKRQNYVLWRKVRLSEINSNHVNTNAKFEMDAID